MWYVAVLATIPAGIDSFQFATLFWVGFSHFPGNIKDVEINYVPTSRAFYPTQPRPWLIPFWDLSVKWIFVAVPFGFLIFLLFYYDHVCRHLPMIQDADKTLTLSRISAA
jgi:TRAP-type C4-dicarboxylate transport system permease small subunit